MQKKSRLSSVPAALCAGGYTGWYLTVTYICEKSLHYYRDDSMLASVDITFLVSMVLTLAGLAAVLLVLDFEGALRNRLLRWLPGVFMAESGIALCMANANSMRVFSAFAGVAGGFGMIAVLSRLLKVKVGRRMQAIGVGLAMGGAMRLLAARIISSSSQRYFLWVAVGIGVIAMLTVHSTGFSSEEAPLVSRAEAAPQVILRKIPLTYLLLLGLCVSFYFLWNMTESAAYAMLPARMDARLYEYAAYAGYVAAALITALFIRLSRLPMLFVYATGMAAAAGCLSMLPNISGGEIEVFALLAFAAASCFKACIFLCIIVFSLDRPHPLFYAIFGYMTAEAGELAGKLIMYNADRLHIADRRDAMIIAMLLLMPIGGAALSRAMSRCGLSQAGFDHRHTMRAQIRKKSAELELFERERMMVECVVLDEYNVDELAAKMLFSRNTVRVLLRPVLAKLGVSDLDGMRAYFEKLTADEERFQETVRKAEDKRRAERRAENVSGFIASWRERLYKRDAEKERRAKEKADRKKNNAGRRTETAGENAAPYAAESDKEAATEEMRVQRAEARRAESRRGNAAPKIEKLDDDTDDITDDILDEFFIGGDGQED